ncbi:MAG: hypothetical protein F9K16_12300 [Thermoanaerobaculia bacterium]|nr:MAG: hypothetical protein F9K16_12300 [Thermoanaerobaculia bacterium]MBZ0102804.1 ABC transporter permease [Thermoanaerobaculia bacterium]
MIRSLVAKEARLQAPFLLLVLIFVAIDWVDKLIARSPELARGDSLLEVVGAYDTATAIATFLLVFSFSVGLLVRELDEGTQEFLDALPLSRSVAFAVKIGLSLSLLCILVLSRAALAAVVFDLSKHSLRPEIPWPWILDSAILTGTQLVFFFGIGLLLSFARPFAWIGFGLLFWIQRLLVSYEPQVRLLDPFSLGTGYLKETPATLPTTHVAVLLGASFVAVALAHRIYIHAGERFAPEEPDTSASGARRWIRGSVAPLTLVVTVATGVYLVIQDPEPAEGSLTKPRRAIAKAQTQRFTMTYPSSLADRARVLLTRADQVHDEVAGVLAASDLTAITVDATGAAPGKAGNAGWSKIRLNLRGIRDPEELKAVLGHETAHVHISRISKQRVDGDPLSSFFQEGLATLIEYDLFRDERERRRLRLMAAAIDERQRISISTLLDPEALNLRYAKEVVYPLGERFFASFRDRHGVDAIRGVLSTLGSEDFPTRPSGVERLQIAFQLAGYDLEVEIGAWKAALQADLRLLGDEIAALPALIPSVDFSNDELWLAIDEAVPAGYALACRLRTSVDEPERAWRRVEAPEGTECSIDRSEVPPTFQIQVGLLEIGSDRQIWGTWETFAE